MKKIGLIGGTSYHSTIVYYKLINELVQKEIGTAKNPPMLVYSENIELMRSQDFEKINAAYLQTSQMLEKAGAQAIVICANTPHLVYDYVQPKINIPILHIASATGAEAKSLGLKTLGLLGNKPTMTKGFIPKILKEDFGINTLIPEAHCLSTAHDYVSCELTQGQFTEESRKFFLNQMDLLKARGADGIILGCTELPILFQNVAYDIPLLSTTDLHAKMAADFITGKI
ncbi:aspartate/glutamate racemase family protein [Christiangramia flava]|uniref:Aspartate racemase n=1 Tax=Christiangramia flava JLT2011 TaxID=1229726 RepID=A0A1L7I431_9FLAO|nr:amino acid racemase [Christiangramia flava]APU68377.1 Aspartate racemase [Christiangramia flava JLT2011]OSS40835.1 Aspartate racemase [Christiangramia flava JLT2011]